VPEAKRIRALVLLAIASLIALVFLWRVLSNSSPAGLLLAAALTLPLWAPLHGLARGDRRTYAWGTLCVIPYLILGITEAIADPGGRLWAAACLALAFATFVGLIGYLRVTRERTPD
jgi:uncharacterized membrane protein